MASTGKRWNSPSSIICLGAGEAFLAGLEHQHRRAVEVARLGQVARRADQHGRMAVMAAAVHHAVLGRLPGEVVLLGHR